MKKYFLLFSLCAAFFACTTQKNKHVFHYVITSTNSVKATDLYGKMGPGIEFNSSEIDIPFEVSHEVYGTQLDYELRITDANTSHDYNVQVYVDDKLINSNKVFDNAFTPSRVGVKGTFIQ